MYPLQAGRGLDEVETFGKFLGGSATNVAVAAARLGARTAIITRTGGDPFGRFVRSELERFGVDNRYVVAVDRLQTPVTFCEIFPPDHFPLYFYQGGARAPYFELSASDLDLEAISNAGIYWSTATGLSQPESAAAHMAAWQARGRIAGTVLDLDYRDRFWDSTDAARAAIAQALPHVSVVIGNRLECEVATGESDPERAAAVLLAAGVDVAIVKQGPLGVLGMSRDEIVTLPAFPVDVANGLGAGDGFGGAICHGLLQGWDLRRVLEFASAAGAIVASRLECANAMPTLAEVEHVLGTSAPIEAPQQPTGIERVREFRALSPAAIAEAYQTRERRGLRSDDGRLLIIAADHPARGALGVRSDGMAMGSRELLLERLVVALGRPGVDGVLGTADVIEELLLMGALEGKLAIGSMNRGGLLGARFELDDRFTAYDAASIAASRLDGGKMLCRVDLDDPGSVSTLESIGRAVTDLASHHVMAMVEPFWSVRVDGRVVNDLSVDSVIKSVSVASGLGATSAYTWLKLPGIDHMDEVMAATTLPALILGGDPAVDPAATYARWETTLQVPGVRGLVVGRALLFPPDGDVATAVDTAARLVHQ